MKKIVLGVIGFFVCLVIVTYPKVVLAETNENKTDIGIQFKHTTEFSKDEGNTEPLTPNNPIIKTSGTLPKTGELLQPVIFLLLGFLLVIILASIYLIVHSNHDKEEEEFL